MNRLLLILIVLVCLVLCCGIIQLTPEKEGVSSSVINNTATAMQSVLDNALRAQLTKTPVVTPSKTAATIQNPILLSTVTLVPSVLSSTPTPVSTDKSSFVSATIPFFILPLLLLSSTFIFARLWLQRGKQVQVLRNRLEREVQANNSQLQTLKENFEKELGKEVQTKNNQLQTLKENFEKEIQNRDDLIQIANDSIKKQIEDTNVLLREHWFKSIVKSPYHNEIEVEVKFIHPLITFLGYQEYEYELRIPVNLQMGHSSIKGIADWVLWDIGTGNNAFVIIEAKAPTQRLENEVIAQARSYAIGLNAPFYVITNGKRFQIFRRDIQQDSCVLSCSVSNLADVWSIVNATIGATARNRNKVR